MHSFQNEPPTKKAKKKKDPNAPKAASNAYMIFCKEKRPKLKEEYEDYTFGQIGSKLGEIWRSMSSEEKKPFEDLATEDRERFRRESEAYESGEPFPVCFSHQILNFRNSITKK